MQMYVFNVNILKKERVPSKIYNCFIWVIYLLTNNIIDTNEYILSNNSYVQTHKYMYKSMICTFITVTVI